MTEPRGGKLEQREIQTLTLWERAQVASVAGTAALGLTYISGYLTAAAYLGTYSISADTSELLRAKYLYIGFEFWLFVAIFGMCLYLATLVLDVFKSPMSEADRVVMREKVAEELVKRRRNKDDLMAHLRLLRWGSAGFQITVVFSFEILFMPLGEFRQYLALQALFLLFLALYQTTFYLEYSSESYGWGIMWGEIYVRWIRWFYSLLFGLGCMVMMVYKFHQAHLDHTDRILTHYTPSKLFIVSERIVIVLTFFVTCFVTLRREPLEWADSVFDSSKNMKSWLQFISAIVLIPATVVYAFYLFGRDVFRLLARAAGGLSFLNKKNGASSVAAGATGPSIGFLNLVGRAIDTVLFCISATLYCYLAFDVWSESSLSIPFLLHLDPIVTARLCAYCTLVLGMLVLTNMVRLSWMHQQRDQDLRIEEKKKKEEDFDRLQRTSDDDSESGGTTVVPTQGWRILGRLAVPVTVLYLVSVLGFAYLVYPFVPANKAGGNYSAEPPVYVFLNNWSSVCVSPQLERVKPNIPFYELEETSDWMYLAQESSGQGPECWEWGTFCTQNPQPQPPGKNGTGQADTLPPGQQVPASASTKEWFRPDVIQVARQCIAGLDSQPPAS